MRDKRASHILFHCSSLCLFCKHLFIFISYYCLAFFKTNMLNSVQSHGTGATVPLNIFLIKTHGCHMHHLGPYFGHLEFNILSPGFPCVNDFANKLTHNRLTIRAYRHTMRQPAIKRSKTDDAREGARGKLGAQCSSPVQTHVCFLDFFFNFNIHKHSLHS